MKKYFLKIIYLIIWWGLFKSNLVWAQSLAAEKIITIQRLEIEGSQFGREINSLLSPYLERKIPLDDLAVLSTAINQFYQNKGYLVSFAVIPLQKFDDGVIKIRVVEGRITELQVSGHSTLKDKYIKAQLKKSLSSQPLARTTLESELRLLQQSPHIAEILAEIRPGLETGNYTLSLQITEAPTTAISIVGDNDLTPTLGDFALSLEAEKRSLFFSRDLVRVQGSWASGLDKYLVSYGFPLNTSEGMLSFSYQNNQSDIVEEPFDALDISGEVEQFVWLYEQPFFRTLNRELNSRLSFDVTNVNSFLFGNPFSLTEGADEGSYRVSALRWGLIWQTRSTKDVLILGSQFSLGTDWFGATNNNNLPDSQFWLWRGQGRWVKALDASRRLQFLLTVNTQLTFDELLPSEQFVLGGLDSVRGYRQNLLLTDNGLNISAEVRIPLLTSKSLGTFQLTPFFDFGTGWNQDKEIDSNTLASLGLGLRWALADRWQFNFGYGVPLIPVKRRGDSLSENGWYVEARVIPFKF